MSQYSMSLRSIINFNSHLEHEDDVFADTKKKIERGREIFFNFNYDGDDNFKQLFENKFLIKNLEENIYCLDVELFMLALQNDVVTKAPIFYNRYKAIEELKKTDLTFGEKTTSKSKTNDSEKSSAKSTSNTSGSSSSTGKTKTSQFPQDINASNFDSINYMDAGTASNESSSNSSSNSSNGNNEMSRSSDNESEFVRTVNPFDRLEKYLDLQLDVITDFVNSFDNLFMHIW